MGMVATAEARLETQILSTYAQGGSYAESILSSVKTAHSLNIRDRLVDGYDKYLVKAKALGDKKSPILGLLFSIEYFLIYSGMAVAFWQGVKMVATKEVDTLGTVFTYVFPRATRLSKPFIPRTANLTHVPGCFFP